MRQLLMIIPSLAPQLVTISHSAACVLLLICREWIGLVPPALHTHVTKIQKIDTSDLIKIKNPLSRHMIVHDLLRYVLAWQNTSSSPRRTVRRR